MVQLPISIAVFFMSLRYGGPAMVCIVNPGLPTSKTDSLDRVGAQYRDYVAPYVMYDRQTQGGSVSDALTVLARAGLGFPVVAKPDEGMGGIDVEVLYDRADLERYLATHHPGVLLHFQRFVADPGEVSLFYVRHPDDQQGRVVALTLKAAPCVVGDGFSTLGELVGRSGRPRFIRRIFLQQNEGHLEEVPAVGERRVLTMVRNVDQGGIYKDLTNQVTSELIQVIDEISRSIPGFFYGRYDIKFGSLDGLLSGREFQILELNGVYSADGRAYSDNARLPWAYGPTLRLFHTMLRIAFAQRAQGHRPPSLCSMALSCATHWWRVTRGLPRS